MKLYDVLILGAGASGLMCAATLDKSLKIGIIDVNNKIALKLKASGGGRCNFTNVSVCASNYTGEDEFIEYFLDSFSNEDLLNYILAEGIEVELKKDRYYFCKNSSDDIIRLFREKTKYADFLLNNQILKVTKKDDIFQVKTQADILRAKKVVVATGGKSYAALGASDIGLDIAKGFGIKVKEFTPALVGLTLQREQFWMRELSGLSCEVAIKIESKIFNEDMLFTHKGISGPAVLSASLYWQKGNLAIDFLPNKNILELIKDDKKLISTALPLPKRLSKALLDALGVEDIECKKASQKTKEELLKIHNYEFAPAGNFGFSKAEVCRGGVQSAELNPYTLEALDIKNLYFIGEVVDVTGELGGYNFQWAFSSAFVCAKAMF